MNIKVIITSVLLFFALQSFGQIEQNDSNKSYVGIIGKYSKGRNVIRWAPSNNVVFFLSLNYGYKLERSLIAIDSIFYKPNWKTVGVFGPADSSAWEKRVDVKNSYQLIAAQAAMGKLRRELGEQPNLFQMMKCLEEEENLQGFALLSADMDTVAANLLGLRYEDLDVVPNAIYSYRIVSLVPDNILNIRQGNTIVECFEQVGIKPPELLQWGYENTVRLDWFNELHSNVYSGYFIERGNAKGKNFVRLNKYPHVLLQNPQLKEKSYQMTFKDSVDKDYVIYSYRLVGLTAFGETSEPGPIVYGYGRDRTPPENAYDIKSEDVNEEALKITWKKKTFSKDFVGFNVLKSENANGPYYIINKKPLDKKTKFFVDNKPNEVTGSFYRVEVIDTAGNKNWSLGVHGFLVDTKAPNKPEGLSGFIDSSGVAHLHWDLGPEKDINGYRVFYANQPDHEFTNITAYPVQDTTFEDTISLASLTSHKYYQIIAVDRHGNHSERSDYLEVKLPDTIPPTKPVFKNILVTDSAVYLSWVPSTSKDVLKHNLYRKKGKGQFVLWEIIEDINTKTISDPKVQIGEVYTYKIEAIDDSENSSGFPNEVSGKIYDLGKRKAIESFNVKYNNDNHLVFLTWNYPKSSKCHFVVYRSYNGSTFQSYKSLKGVENVFVDKRLLGKGEYVYGVVAYYLDGGSSGMTKRKSIIIE